MREKILEYFTNASFVVFYAKFVKLIPHTQSGDNIEVVCPFPDHDDRVPSFSFNQTSGLCKCFGCGFEGDIFSFFAKLKGLNIKADFPEILNQICDDFGIEKPPVKKPRRKIVSTYDYVDENGKLLYQVVRYEPKDFRQRRPDRKDGWVWNLRGIKRVLYRLPEILKSDYAILTEGERDVDRLVEIGLVATTNPGGANKWKNLQSKYGIGEPLAGKDIVIIPDNDTEGREDAQIKARCLRGIAKTIKVLNIPDLPDKGDVSDFIEKYDDQEKANEQLCQMIENCEPWQPKPSTESPEQKPVEERLTIHSVSDLLRAEFKYVTPVIAEGILPQGAGMILAGEGGVGKSLILLEWIIRLVMGWKILDIDVPTSRTIKIFQRENIMEQVQFRIRKMLQGFQITNLPNKIFFSDPETRYDLGQKASVKKIRNEIEECGADVFILDALSSFHHVNENDNILMRNMLDEVTWISRKTGAAATIIDHFGKPSKDRQDVAHRTRGASAKRDWADTMLTITHRKHENKTLRQIDFIKIRNGPERKSVLVERDGNFIHEITEEDMLVPVSKVKEILEDLGGRADKQIELINEILRETGCTEKTARTAIKKAVDMKYINVIEGGRSKSYYV